MISIWPVMILNYVTNWVAITWPYIVIHPWQIWVLKVGRPISQTCFRFDCLMKQTALCCVDRNTAQSEGNASGRIHFNQ